MASKTQTVLIAGLDEVGIGPLAGPVYAAAVILPAGFVNAHIKDSKLLTDKKRQALSDLIKTEALAWSIARAEVEEIEAINILQAGLLAMKRAAENLSIKPTQLLVDGKYLPKTDIPAKAIIGGDKLVAEISAASILAKVARDNEMIALDKVYPGYGFASHKGYGTRGHLEALTKLGPCAIHRRQYEPVARLLNELSEV